MQDGVRVNLRHSVRKQRSKNSRSRSSKDKEKRMINIQNRTQEFQKCVISFDKVDRKQNGRRPKTQNSAPKKSQFSQQASIIAKDIANMTSLLSKLALLAKRKPMFDDKPVEISELTYVIKQDIFKIEDNIRALQRYANGDTSIQIDSQTGQYSKSVLTLLNSKMKNVSGEFKKVLETRQKNELINKNRTEQFLSAATNHRSNNNKSPLAVSPYENSNEGLKHLGENPYLHTGADSKTPPPYNPDLDPNITSPYEDSSKGYLSIPDQSRQLLLMEEQGNQYLQERSSAVETIESTINEVGNLFQQLASMVSEQGEQIQRIDQDVDDINLNISGAQRELLKYYAHISSNRWLFLKIFGVLLVFFFIWVLVS